MIWLYLLLLRLQRSSGFDLSFFHFQSIYLRAGDVCEEASEGEKEGMLGVGGWLRGEEGGLES